MITIITNYYIVTIVATLCFLHQDEENYCYAGGRLGEEFVLEYRERERDIISNIWVRRERERGRGREGESLNLSAAQTTQ